MPKNEPSSASIHYQIFVSRPLDAVGLVAFGLYQKDEIQFIDHELPALGTVEDPQVHIDAFRRVAIKVIETYRGRAREILKDYFAGRDVGLPREALLKAVKDIRGVANDGEIDNAIKLVFSLLDAMPGQSGRREDFGVIAGNHAIFKKRYARGLLTGEEIRIGFATAMDAISMTLNDIEADISDK